ncbi:MAG: hypothetical protein Q4D28_02410 [Prevotellaceae bacterium]|nr:hypothetical protein [Prevotellaceae bacterium]
MKRTTILSLLLLLCVAMQAQTDNIKVLANGNRFMRGVPEAVEDKDTGEKTVVWPYTENSWVKDFCWVKDVPVENSFDKLFPTLSDWRSLLSEKYTMLCWRLTEESGETILHCYYLMPNDVVKNLWLASQETAIVDMETGVQYRARRTVPDCLGKHFGVRAKTGSILDLRIHFPKLPDTTRRIAIYGVPVWNMRGQQVELARPLNGAASGVAQYDAVPKFHKPRLVKAASAYDRDNAGTWAVYTDAHLIKPQPENTMALWRTPDATYLAFATEQNWMREYYGRGDNNVLVDQTGRQYKIREVLDYPTGDIFWVEGCSGDFLAFVLVFEPLPLDVTSFTYMAPEGKPFSAWGANWAGMVLPNLSVESLRANQSLFEYQPRTVVR